jgi:hypothetical protein
MCCIDGEDGEMKTHGLRGTEIEIACITTTFAADPGMYVSIYLILYLILYISNSLCI